MQHPLIRRAATACIALCASFAMTTFTSADPPLETAQPTTGDTVRGEPGGGGGFAACLDSVGNCFINHGGTGCENEDCCIAVCTLDPFCCDVQWDSSCIADAFKLCSIAECLTSTGDCFNAEGVPGCDMLTCCQIVCSQDAFCCDVQWDSSCASQATDLCSTNVVGACCLPDGFCVDVTALTDCTFQLGGAFFTGTCATAICPQPQCPGTGACFDPSGNGGVGCQDEDCCNLVCNIDGFCCDSEWDNICATLAVDNCIVPTACIGSEELCFTPGSIGCNNAACCAAVCEADPFCCDASWDGTCVGLALTVCDPLIDEDGACCLETGACADVATVSECAKLGGVYQGEGTMCANVICPFPQCGLIGSGNCALSNITPGCSDQDCCNIVCNSDPFCCDVEWDETCVAGAVELCAGPECGLGNGSCFSGNGTTGCESRECCYLVCFTDAFCCDTEWDELCADNAAVVCTNTGCGDDASGSCYLANGTQGCDDPDCCYSVCVLDDFCCEAEWDATCVTLAESTCTFAGACCVPNGDGTFTCTEVPGIESCIIAGGFYQGDGTTCDLACDVNYNCTGDCAPDNGDGTYGNGDINIDDIVAIINNFGPCPPNTQPCPWDCTPINADGTVGQGDINIDDIVVVLNQFGDGCK